MLYRLVRPVRRSGSSIPQFVQRIPADVRDRAVGRTLSLTVGTETVPVTVTPTMGSVRLSLRSRDPREAKARQASLIAQLETAWAALRRDVPVMLSHRQATALAGDLYRSWADERRETRLSVVQNEPGGPFVRDRSESPEEMAGGFADAAETLAKAADAGGLEAHLGSLVDRLLLARGIAAVDPECRGMVLEAFHQALRDAFAHRRRNAAGDYAPDPQAARFPQWEPVQEKPADPPPPAKGDVSLSGLLEGWWTEAQATGRKPSTHDSYRRTVAAFVAFLGHDDAARVTADDVVRFKDHRLASVHPRTGKPVSPKTVKDGDLAGLKTVFGWAVTNRRLSANPAAGITIKLGKARRVRSKGLTDEEARALLRAASNHRSDSEMPQTAAAKRWVPWLLAYTGARVGEMAQLRKEDVRREGEHWVVRITPEAGTVKTNEARDVVLHPHLVEMGFPAFVAAAPAGHLFLKVGKNGDVRGPWRGLKNRLRDFARAIVTDPNVAPNHGWRHRFKTVGREAGIDGAILDAIQGQAPASVAASYGDFSIATIAAAIGRLPRIEP